MMMSIGMSIVIEKNEYLYKDEVAKELKIAEPTLTVKIRAKEVPLPIKLKSKNIWKKSDIEKYLKDTKEQK